MTEKDRVKSEHAQDKNVISALTFRFQERLPGKDITLEEYLALCRKDPGVYKGAPGRIIEAIGEPKLVDTSRGEKRLSRIFMNRTIKRFDSFSDFFGMEETIERIMGFFIAASQDLEERKQILYLLGPVGGGKSSIAERLKKLMEKLPVYVLKAGGKLSPVFESPLGLFDPDVFADDLERQYNIPRHRLTGVVSPWAAARLREFKGDYSQFRVACISPSVRDQVCVMKTEPGDENTQDISTLVGKLDIRQLEHHSAHDPDAYSFSGGLNRTTQGILDFVEMFKAPIKMLHPLLTATQEGHYTGTENVGAIPYQGIILAHSNEAEWQQFKSRTENEPFLDRVFLVKVPYCLRVDEEVEIYKKHIANSALANNSVAPETFEILARFAVLTRLKEHENSDLWTKMRVYNGEALTETGPNVKSLQEYRDAAGVDEGMKGTSPRFSFKVLDETFNYDPHEIAADPIHLMYILERCIKAEQFPEEKERHFLELIKETIAKKYGEFIGNEIRKAYLESADEYGQNIFDRYISYADAWIEEQDFKDPDTGQVFEREYLDSELSKIEKPAGIANPKDFRNEVVKFALRARAKDATHKNPKWSAYEKMRVVIEKHMFSQIKDLMPVISFTESQKDTETSKKHSEFVERMKARGYTSRQVRRLVEWHMRMEQSS